MSHPDRPHPDRPHPDPKQGRDVAPAYRIRIAGHLGARIAGRFDAMTVTCEADGTTLLTGELPDQAALHGVLRKLRDLGLPLLSVARIDREGVPAPENAREPERPP